MGFFLFIILIVISVFLVKKIKSPNKKSHHDTYFFYDNYQDDFYDNYDDNTDINNNSSFAYPDPYELPPESAIYLDEDGEILEDL